jgi:hypothetical protein
MEITSFREAAERRIAELEQAERDRQVKREARAIEQRASAVADRERREAKLQADAEHAAADARAQLARRFGIAATRVVLAADYYVFTVEHRDIAVAYRRDVTAYHPGGGAPGHAPALMATNGSSLSWRRQLALQNVLRVGVDMPTIVRGDALLEAAGDAGRLLVDPTPVELARIESRNP